MSPLRQRSATSFKKDSPHLPLPPRPCASAPPSPRSVFDTGNKYGRVLVKNGAIYRSQFPCLWNTSIKDNRNLDKKDAAWKSIVDDLKLDEIKDIKTAKLEWQKLRDNHRDSLKRMKNTTSRQAATTNNNWKYAELMEFLLPYMKNRTRSTNLDTENTQSTRQSETRETHDVENIKNDSYSSIVLSPLNDSNTQVNHENTETKNERRKRKTEADVVELLSEMEQNHKKRQEIRDLKRKPKTAIDLFMESMAMTINTIPTWMHSRIKRKIFSIVNEAEEELENYSLSVTPESTAGSSRHGYQTTEPPAGSSRHGYQTTDPPAGSSRHGYQTTEPLAGSSRHGYQKTEPPAGSSRHGYQTTEPPAGSSRYYGYQTSEEEINTVIRTFEL